MVHHTNLGFPTDGRFDPDITNNQRGGSWLVKLSLIWRQKEEEEEEESLEKSEKCISLT